MSHIGDRLVISVGFMSDSIYLYASIQFLSIDVVEKVIIVIQ